MQTSLHSQQSPQRLATLRILLVRHGLSEDNLNSIWAGHRDSPLASTGILQAKALGASLANYNLSAIYSSDLKRASRTAEEILQANRSIPPPPLVQTQSLREQYFGQAEGKSWSDTEFAISTHGEDARTFRFPEGESLEEVNGRMGVSLRRYVLPRLEALRSGQERYEPQIVILAHGIAIAELLRVLMALHDNSANSPWPDPRETYVRVRLENTGWTLVELAVNVDEAEDANEGTLKRKSIFSRIVQQNNTDHLRGFSSSTPNGSVGTSSKSYTSGTTVGPGNGVGSLLAGGLASSDILHGQPPPMRSNSQSGASKAVNTYDAKYLMRELERAGSSTTMLSGSTAGSSSTLLGPTAAAPIAGAEGMLAIPASLASTTPTISSPSHSIATTQSPAITTLSPNPSLATAPSAWSDLWQGICVRILPLFNDEDLKGHVEDINDSVSSHIQRTLDRSPARAMDALSKDLYALCATGMYTLNARLNLHFPDDFRLLETLTETWTVFFTNILPWLEACFLPLQTDLTLASLSKTDDKPLSSLQTEPIDIRSVALTAFRDQVLLYWFDRILPLFSHVGNYDIDLLSNHQTRQKPRQEREEKLLYPRLMQMTNILASIHNSEEAQAPLDELLRALRAGNETFLAALNPQQHAGLTSHARNTPSNSAAMTASTKEKRNHARQGWLPKSAVKHGNKSVMDVGNESAYQSSLKSPIVEDPSNNTTPTSSTEDVGANNSSHSNNINNFHNAGEQNDSANDESASVSRPYEDEALPFVPLQESPIGLGLPALDQWDNGEARSANHI